jgi:hypothetical protein
MAKLKKVNPEITMTLREGLEAAFKGVHVTKTHEVTITDPRAHKPLKGHPWKRDIAKMAKNKVEKPKKGHPWKKS